MKSRESIIKVLIFILLFLCILCVSCIILAQDKQPYTSDKPIPDPVPFEITGVNNPWHFAFTPDGKTVYYLLDSSGMEVVYYSQFKNGKWSKSKMAPFAGKYRIETPSISPDGSKFYFALPVRVDSFDNVKLYSMDRTSTGWSEPREMGQDINISIFQNCPRAVKNGNFYFTSYSNGEFHIYQSKLENGKYAKSKKLGTQLDKRNTADFCIAQDERFIIYEQHYNLYITFNEDGVWSSPISLGENINTKEYEGRPYISPDEKYLFFKRMNTQNWQGPNLQVELKPLVTNAKKKLLAIKDDMLKINFAKGKKVMSSSNESQILFPENAVDESNDTRWSSEFSDPQWFMVDLGKVEKINKAVINWEAFAEKYKIEVSTDLAGWQEVYSTDGGRGGIEELNFPASKARFVKITGLKRGSQYGYSIINLEVYGDKTLNEVWQQCTPLPEKFNPACASIGKKLYAVKGSSDDYKTPGYVCEYDPVKNTWTKKASMPVCKVGFQSFVYDDKLYTIGGISDTAGTRSNTLEEYNPVTDAWKQEASMKVGREGIGMIVYKNKVYAFGGFKAKNDSDTNAVEVYDPKTNIWETKAPMPTSRAWTRVTSLNNKIYLFGGFGAGKHQIEVDEYNPETNTWVKKKPAPHQEPLQFAREIDGTIYGVFTISIGNNKTFTEKYDPLKDKWTSAAEPFQTTFFDFASVVSGQNIFFISGFQNNPNNVTKGVYRFDIAQKKWERISDLNFGRVAMGAEILDDTIYVLGGQFGWYTNPVVYTDSVEKLSLKNIIKNEVTRADK